MYLEEIINRFHGLFRPILLVLWSVVLWLPVSRRRWLEQKLGRRGDRPPSRRAIFFAWLFVLGLVAWFIYLLVLLRGAQSAFDADFNIQ